MSGRTIIFAGGGTGGHIFPSLAIARALEYSDERNRCVFVCSQRAIDAEILNQENRSFVAIPAQPFSVQPRAISRLCRSWGACVRASRRLIQQERLDERDVAVVAMGGFVAPSVAQGAHAERAPVTLVNLDSAPGRANRWISKRAQNVLTTCAIDNQPAWIKIRPIVRDSAQAPCEAHDCRARLGLATNIPTLVVVGGSLGARTINKVMEHLLTTQPELFDGWQVFHQAGKADAARLIAAYKKAGVPARVVAFHSLMGEVWGAADLAIARAGAGTVAELQANAVPSVLLPYPFHKDEHQRQNAQPIAEANGGVIVTDLANAQTTSLELAPTLQRLLRDDAAREQMRNNLRSLGAATGAQDVADRLLSLA